MTQFTTPAIDTQAPADWIDYPKAEAALFDALNGPGGYGRILAADYARQFGADVAAPSIVEDMAGALFGAAARIASEQGTRRVFSDTHLLAKCRDWAAHYAEREQWQRDRLDRLDREAARRRAYTLAQYGGEAREEIGRERSLANRRTNASAQARRCATLRRCGWTLARIADGLGIAKRTVQRHLVAHAARIAEARIVGRAVELVKWTFGKEQSVRTKPSNTGFSTEQPLPNVHVPRRPPEPPPPAQIDAMAAQIPAMLRAHWGGL